VRRAAIPWDRPRDRMVFESFGNALVQVALREGIFTLTASTSELQRHLHLILRNEHDPGAFSRKAVTEMRSRWRRAISAYAKDGTVTSKATGVTFTLLPKADAETLVTVAVPEFETDRGARIDVVGTPGDPRGRLPDVATLHPRSPNDPVAQEILIDWCVTTARGEKRAYRDALAAMPLLDVEAHVLERTAMEKRGEPFDVHTFLAQHAPTTVADHAAHRERRKRADNVRQMRALVEQEYANVPTEHQEFIYKATRALLDGLKASAVAIGLIVVLTGATLVITQVFGLHDLQAAIINTIERAVKRVLSREALQESVRELNRASEGGRRPAIVIDRDPVSGDTSRIWWFPDGQYGRQTDVKDLSVHLPDIMEQVREFRPAPRMNGRVLPAQIVFFQIGPRDVGIVALPRQEFPHAVDLRRMSLEGGPRAKAAIPWTYHIQTLGASVMYTQEPQIVTVGDAVVYQVLARAEYPKPGTYAIYGFLAKHVEGDPIAVSEKWQIRAEIRIESDGTVTPLSQAVHAIP
jgi:hypothetical protein